MTTTGKKKRFRPRQLAVPMAVGVLAFGLAGCPGPTTTDGGADGEAGPTDVTGDNVLPDVPTDAQPDVQADVQPDVQDVVTDTGPMPGCTDTRAPTMVHPFASCGSVCSSPTDAVLSNDGTTAYFTAFNATGGGAVFSATMGGTPTMLAMGYQYPIGLTIAPDGSALYVVDFINDAAATSGNHSTFVQHPSTLYRVALPAGTSTNQPITGMGVTYITGIGISDDGNTLYVTSSASDTMNGLYSLGTTGGMPMAIAQGTPFVDPAGLTVGPNNTFFVNDVRSAPAWRGNVIAVNAGAATRRAQSHVSRFPAGIALGCDNMSMLVAGAAAGPGEPRAGLSWVAADGTTVTAIASSPRSPTGVHRARNANVFVVADDEAGAMYTGSILTVTP